MEIWGWAQAIMRPLVAPLDSRMNAEAVRNAGQSAWDLHLHHQAKADAGLLEPLKSSKEPPSVPSPRDHPQPAEDKHPVLP